MENRWECLRTIRHRSVTSSDCPTEGRLATNLKAALRADTHTPMFRASLFPITTQQTQPDACLETKHSVSKRSFPKQAITGKPEGTMLSNQGSHKRTGIADSISTRIQSSQTRTESRKRKRQLSTNKGKNRKAVQGIQSFEFEKAKMFYDGHSCTQYHWTTLQVI